MKFDSENEIYILKSGQTFPANNGIIGISGAGYAIKEGLIHEGYDGGIFIEFTKEEKMEISQYMINLWKNWANTY